MAKNSGFRKIINQKNGVVVLSSNLSVDVIKIKGLKNSKAILILAGYLKILYDGC